MSSSGRYRQRWRSVRGLVDLKHPGVFFFFAAGGTLFGFNEIGTHLFELLWMLAVALVARRVAGQYAHNPAVASLAPVFTAGTYYACTTSYHFTGKPSLVATALILLVAAVMAVVLDLALPLAWLFVSGLAAGSSSPSQLDNVVLPLLFWLTRRYVAAGQRPEHSSGTQDGAGAAGWSAAARVGRWSFILSLTWIGARGGFRRANPRGAASRGGV